MPFRVKRWSLLSCHERITPSRCPSDAQAKGRGRHLGGARDHLSSNEANGIGKSYSIGPVLTKIAFKAKE